MTRHNAAESGRPIRDPDAWAPRLARLLDRQRALYERLAALSDAQTACILDDRTEDLLSILSRRQELIEQIARLNEEIAPFVREWDHLAPTLSPAHRSTLRERFDAVAALVESISRRDDADRARIEERRAAMRADIEAVPAVRAALGAYNRPSAPDAVFHDSTG